MSAAQLDALTAIIQEDVGNRGLRADPADNLVTRTVGDFAAACRSVAAAKPASIGILTGFYILSATPPAGETDGPLGAIFLARGLVPLGIDVTLITDGFCSRALDVALEACELGDKVSVFVLPGNLQKDTAPLLAEWNSLLQWHHLTHLIALERVGPSHADGRCYTMRGRDITDFMSPAHFLLEDAAKRQPAITTIGIGDGGNEIGMGKIPREVIAKNIPRGDLVACRVPTDHLIVCGVSNWGAYALAAGVRLLRGTAHDPGLFDLDRERDLLQLMVKKGPLVDGVAGKQTATVDGLSFEKYAEVLRKIGEVVGKSG